jgi:20S proteasome alpha/beta subunit
MTDMVSRSKNERSALLPLAEHCLAPKPHQSYLERLGTNARKPYILSVRRENCTMTIAVAVTYEYGIVLCSDRLITHGGMFSHYEKKAVSFATARDCSVAICGTTDDYDVMRSVVQGIADRFKFDPELDEKPILRDVLDQELARMYSKPLVNSPTLELLVAETNTVGLDCDFKLYKTSGPHVMSANPFDCVGIGDTSLVRYISDNLYDPRISAQNAIALGIYLVQMAKRYMPQYVGGQTDVFDITGGNCIQINEKEIKSVEDQLDKHAKSCLGKLLERASQRVNWDF